MGFYTASTIIATITVAIGFMATGVRLRVSRLKLFILIPVLTLSTFVGARSLFIITHAATSHISFWDIEAHGFSLMGGLLLPIITGYIVCRAFRIEAWNFADKSVPYVGAGIAIMRIGCFLHGCCFGKETQLPWGISFPLLSPAHLYQLKHTGGELLFVHPVHPTQLYEAAGALAGSAIAIFVLRKRTSPGVAFLSSGMWFMLWRIFTTPYRVPDESMSVSANFYPAMYAVSILILCVLILRRGNISLFLSSRN